MRAARNSPTPSLAVRSHATMRPPLAQKTIGARKSRKPCVHSRARLRFLLSRVQFGQTRALERQAQPAITHSSAHVWHGPPINLHPMVDECRTGDIRVLAGGNG